MMSQDGEALRLLVMDLREDIKNLKLEIQSANTEVHSTNVSISSLKSDMENLKQDVHTTNILLRDGNGQPSVIQRLTVLESNCSSIHEDIKTLENSQAESSKQIQDTRITLAKVIGSGMVGGGSIAFALELFRSILN